MQVSPGSLAISAAIITRNEEHTIARCLASLLWVDEIVVVDAQSSDRTAEICQNAQAPWAKKIRFFAREWPGFNRQRTFAMEQARNDWILVLDADECCSPELAEKIQALLRSKNGPPNTAYKIRRIEYFLGKAIHYGVWNPSYQDRFFNRNGVKYVNEIHEYPIFPHPPDRLHEPIFHFPDFSPEKFLEKMNKYTTIEARERVTLGQRTNLFRILGAFPAMFLKNYFYYKAYRDGVHGLIISLLEGVSRVVRHIKIWQIQHQENLRT